MELVIFSANAQGLLELVSEPSVDDEDAIIVPVVLRDLDVIAVTQKAA
jgi:hypothetical protein